MKFNNLAEVQAHQFTGNGGGPGQPDFEAFQALHEYLQTDAPFEERHEALNHAFLPYTGVRDNRDPKRAVTEYLREWVLKDDEEDE